MDPVISSFPNLSPWPKVDMFISKRLVYEWMVWQVGSLLRMNCLNVGDIGCVVRFRIRKAMI